MSRRDRPTPPPIADEAPSGTAAPPPVCPPAPPTPAAVPVCPVCGFRGQLFWVHGEGRCPRCGTVLDTCCGGAPLGGG